MQDPVNQFVVEGRIDRVGEPFRDNGRLIGQGVDLVTWGERFRFFFRGDVVAASNASSGDFVSVTGHIEVETLVTSDENGRNDKNRTAKLVPDAIMVMDRSNGQAAKKGGAA